ncbi:endonuclease YncB(thermonuclease family) [Rhizobium sp. BK275]|uniref:thermonuclease family protein n=1 Tax=Rhizobium sp. BK275 TaxID=2587077 RepID=UPI001617AA97|nr:thermonuclease family protein [Rhizobium sp. BK275]MBB3388957.1 endonuclease YncB(thermonuclease family) [Rhizobium sp. BK275]
MRPAAFITGIAGMAIVTGLLLAGQARLNSGDGAAPDADAGSVTAELPDADTDRMKPPASLTDEDAALIARATEPAAAEPGAAPSPPPSGNATANETAQSEAAPAETSPATAAGKDSVELLRPTVENAGLLSFGKRRLQITGIIATPADKSCGSEGKQWPCGMMAKTALRLFLRNRAIDCDLPSDAWKDMASAACRLGQQDIGTWLVENGWAEAQPGSPLAAAGEKAKQAKEGIHGEDPRRRPAAVPRPETAAPL